jgi:hypothetical protein
MQRNEFGSLFRRYEDRPEIMIADFKLLELDWDRTQSVWQGS